MFLGFFNKKINFILPNLFNNFYINKFFIELKNSNPNYFYNDCLLSQVYGNIPYSIWGLNNTRKYAPLKNIKQVFDFYYQNKLSINLFFENNFLKEEHLYDTYSNSILEAAHKKGNYITLVSDILEKYINKNYPKFKIIKIVNKNGLGRKNIFIESRLNNQLNNLKIKYKSDTYLMLNPLCIGNCPLYDFHREYISKEQLYYNENGLFLCPLENDLSFYSSFKNPDFISINRLKELNNKGFKYFVINNAIINRSINKYYTNIDLTESYIYYLIKPEYHDFVRKNLTKQYFVKVRRKVNAKI